MPHAGGRPPKEIDFKQLDELCKIQCTQKEICAILDVDEETLNKRIREKCQLSFSDYYDLKRADGRRSLRRAQFATALGDEDHPGNPTMQIWLGKNWLDQKDKAEIENKGSLKIEWPEALKKELG